MADLSITASAVQAAAAARTSRGLAGAAITAGQSVYVDANGKVQPARANAALTSAAVGIALHAASTDQPISYIEEGDLTVNAVLTVGMPYVTSAAVAGAIAPVGDLVSGNFRCELGVARSTTVLAVKVLQPIAALGADIV